MKKPSLILGHEGEFVPVGVQDPSPPPPRFLRRVLSELYAVGFERGTRSLKVARKIELNTRETRFGTFGYPDLGGLTQMDQPAPALSSDGDPVSHFLHKVETKVLGVPFHGPLSVRNHDRHAEEGGFGEVTLLGILRFGHHDGMLSSCDFLDLSGLVVQ